MTNSRAGTVMRVAAVMLVTAMLVGCSREKIDWKSAEAADTVEAYDHFLERHPDGELSTQARARVAQLNEERDWKKASAADTADSYRQFLAQHAEGKWAGEARIRVENFALDGTATGPLNPPMAAPAVAMDNAATRPGAAAAPAITPPPPASAPSPVAKATAAANAGAITTAASAATPAAASKPAVSAKPVTANAQAAPIAPKPQFGIQLGAFRTQQAALSDWKRIQARFQADLQGLFARAVPIQQAAGQIFRLQAPVGEEGRARAICASLAKQSQPCVVVLPQPH